MNEPILEQDLAAPSVDEEVLALLAAVQNGEHEPDGERLRCLARDSPEFREQLRDLEEELGPIVARARKALFEEGD